MKIKAINQSVAQEEEKQIFDIYLELLEQHGKVFIYKLEDEVFIYKPIGRKDLITIATNADLSNYDREEIICETCTLYPQNYDFANCVSAGLPSLYSKEILEASYCANESQVIQLINYYRNDMGNIQNQVSCMIQEAFPNLDFDEIENFDMETTMRYLSRAEWILTNLRNMEFTTDPFAPMDTDASLMEDKPTAEDVELAKEKYENLAKRMNLEQSEKTESNNDDYIDFKSGETTEERLERLKTKKIKKEVLTPEKLAQLRRIAPEIDWTHKNTEADFQVNSSKI